MSSDYVLEKLDELRDSIRDEGVSRENLEDRVRELEMMLEADTWAGKVRDLTGSVLDLESKMDALAGRFGGFDWNEETEEYEFPEDAQTS